MRVGLQGIGIWSEGIGDWSELVACVNNDNFEPRLGRELPKPAAIPARELRRAPLVVKLAMAAIDDAAAMAGIPQNELCSVFSSSMGDSRITDYICRTLSGPEKMLSPTQFHNSVNNVTSGYWSIAAENRLPSSFVSGFKNSFPVALIESAALCLSEQKPTVLALYDIAFGEPFYDLIPNSEHFAAAFVLTPAASTARWSLDISTAAATHELPTSNNTFLNERIAANSSAAALVFCEWLANDDAEPVHWPLGNQSGEGSLLLSR